MENFTIGQVAKRTGVGVETIRFYERQGLINDPPRKESGYRQYNNDAILRLAFIHQAKDLGFSLKEIGELLSIKSDTDAACKDVKLLAQDKLESIESKIKILQRMRKTLKKLVDICPGDGPLSDCPILDVLDRKSHR